VWSLKTRNPDQFQQCRDERRRDFLQKQREAEAERRKAAAAAAGSRVPNSKTPEPTGIQIFTKVEVGRKPGVGDAAERRKAYQEQQVTTVNSWFRFTIFAPRFHEFGNILRCGSRC